MKFLYKSFSFFCFTFLALFSLQLNASVIMTGTRIIYNEGSRSVDVNLKNQSDFPYVVQTWFDDGKMSSGPDASVRVPFIASPPVFRIQPGAGQVVKVTFTGGFNLPDDRESVFYFNFFCRFLRQILTKMTLKIKCSSCCVTELKFSIALHLWCLVQAEGYPIYR